MVSVAIGLVAMTMMMTATAEAAGFATGGIGIKARSMGGAFRGIADDWSAAGYNPAGLAYLENNEFNVTLGTYSPRMTYIPNVTSNGVDLGFRAANGLEMPPENDLWPIPSLAGMMAPSSENGIAYGLAVYWPHDVNYGWDLYREPPGYSSNFDFSRESYRTDLDVLDIHPTVAKRFGDKLALGAGLSLTNGDVVLRRIVFIPNPLGDGPGGLPFDDYPFANFIAEYRMEGNGFAVGGNIGLMWKPSETFSIGISVQSPITIPMEGDATLDIAWPNDINLSRAQLNLDRDLNDTVDYDRSFFAGNKDVSVSAPSHSAATWKMDLDLPGQIGAGIGWQVSERFTVAVDFAVTFWSAVDVWNIELGGAGFLDDLDSMPNITSQEIPFHWEDQIRLSAGAEHWAKENLAIRFGGYYEGGAAVDETFSPNFPDVGDHFGLSAGFAYHINDLWEVAAAQEFAFYGKRDVPTNGVADGITTFPGEYSLTRYETIISLAYRF